MSFDLGSISYSFASLCLLALILVQLKIWSADTPRLLLLTASVLTFTWCLVLAYHSITPVNWFWLVQGLEILKNLSWFALLLSILGVRENEMATKDVAGGHTYTRALVAVSLGLPVLSLLFLFYLQFTGDSATSPDGFGGRPFLFAFQINAIIGLVLLEQVVRNTKGRHVWHVKFLYLGLGVQFLYDTYMYSTAFIFGQLHDGLWQARGIVIALACPLMAISLLRTRLNPLDLHVSRRLVFHTGLLVAAVSYLLVVIIASLYIGNISGEWGFLLQVTFWVVSLSLLVVLFASGKLRSTLRLYINRHLFSSKYDYRDEWMRISDTLSQPGADESTPELVIRALADVFDSTGGALWLSTDNTYYDQSAYLDMGWIGNSSLSEDDYLIQFMRSTGVLIDLEDPDSGLDRESLPQWLLDVNKAWLLVPLQLQERLVGFVLLKESRAGFDLTWEDYELAKAAGQQAASSLSQMIAFDALSEARQFSAFNQASAFVMHDLKTLNSQLSLMVQNAAKHKSNPAFVEDMISTTEHVVNKMTFLLEHFQSNTKAGAYQVSKVDLVKVVNEVVSGQTKLRPCPVLSCDRETIEVLGSHAELESSIGHLVQNAQEATAEDHKVEIDLTVEDDKAVLTIEDSGSGMTDEFINTQLFKPFTSTKGTTGMGIGVYQCRSTVRKLHGDLRVQSQLGKGSKFTITLPLHEGR